jgi:hypothetical protein
LRGPALATDSVGSVPEINTSEAENKVKATRAKTGHGRR